MLQVEARADVQQGNKSFLKGLGGLTFVFNPNMQLQFSSQLVPHVGHSVCV